MNNKLTKIASLAVSAVCALSCLAGCGGSNGGSTGKKNGDGTNFQQSFLDPIDQEKYFIGMCALTGDTMSEAESGSTAEWIAKNNKALGVKCQRVWMHIPDVLERDANSNSLTLKTEQVQRYHNFIDELTENGVERIMAMSHGMLYPHDYVKMDENDRQVFIHPIEEAEFYKDWIQMYYEAYKILATEFPEINFWECGNEFDSSPFMHRNDKSLMTADDMGFIDADLCYAANKAIKEVNPNNACVFPGLTCTSTSELVLEAAYTHIEQKKLPTLEDHYVDDPDDYFDVMAWHPYPDDGGYARTKSKCDALRKIMVEHGDAEKRVFFTEYGYSTAYPDKFQEVAEMLADCFKQIKRDMDYVETVYFFRMSDRYEKFAPENLKENYFGCFYSPNDPVNLGKPKPLAIEFFKFINGEDADPSPLYWYYNEMTGQSDR